MKTKIENLLSILVAIGIVFCIGLGSSFAASDTQVVVTDSAYYPFRATNTNATQKVYNFDVKAASAEIRTVTMDVRGWKRGIFQLASGHVGASTFSTSGSMEATAYAWLEFTPASSGGLLSMASMPIQTASSSITTGATTAVQVKGNYYFDTYGAAFMLARVFGNATTDKQLTFSFER